VVKINIQGTVFGSSGYDIHTRMLCNALHEEGAEVSLQVPLPQNWMAMVNDSELLMINRGFMKDATTLAIMMPPHWRFPLAEKPKHFIGFCVWEGDRIPQYWMDILFDKRIDKIFVPSIHTDQAIMKTRNITKRDDFPLPIDIVPHGVNSTIFPPKEKILDNDTFTFISNKGFPRGEYDRGGMQYLLKAYYEEFTKEDKVQLSLKINPAYNPPNWNFKDELDKLGIKKKDSSPMMNFNADLIDYKKLYEFYHRGDVFVAPTMGEAFGLPMIESMSCGVPVICTGYGGQTDFINNDNGWLLDYELKHHSNEVAYEEVKWAIPNMQQLKMEMRNCYENWIEKTDMIKDKSQKAIETAREFSWKNSAKKVIKIVEELE